MNANVGQIVEDSKHDYIYTLDDHSDSHLSNHWITLYINWAEHTYFEMKLCYVGSDSPNV